MSFLENHLFCILRRFSAQSLPPDLFLGRYFKEHRSLGAHDRRFVGEAFYGMVRQKRLLEHLTSPHASWEEKFCTYQKLKEIDLSQIPPALRYSFPDALYARFEHTLGPLKAQEIASVCNEQAPTVVRANPLKISREELIERWKELGAEKTALSPYGIKLKKRGAFFASEEFKKGFFEMQDEGSQLVALLVEAKPKDLVLDYCSGSGGKSLAFAHKMQGQGQLYLHDIRPHLLVEAKKRFKRAGIQHGQFLLSTHPQMERLKGKMDWVIADVPCSGSGTYRRNPDMRWKYSDERFFALLQEQRTIFEKAKEFVRPGGHILYATCSFFKEENEEQIDYFLKKGSLELTKTPFSSLPTTQGMDGFFAAVLRSR